MKFDKCMNIMFFATIIFLEFCGYLSIRGNNSILADILGIFSVYGFINFIATIKYKNTYNKQIKDDTKSEE